MARQNAEFDIDRGPSKLDLMLSLFDTDMGARTVSFWVGGRLIQGNTFGGYDVQVIVQIISAKRQHPSAKSWDIEGITEIQGGKRLVSIYYQSDTRKGSMTIEEDELRVDGVMETSSGARQARALMIIIQKMIARYQNSHRDNLDEEIFRLFEKAKRVSCAEDYHTLVEAIKNI